MFGLFTGITAFFATLKAMLVSGMIGAVIGAGAAVIGRVFGGFSSILVAAALGAVVTVGAFHTGRVTDNKQQEIERLTAEKEKLEFEAKATEAAYAKEQELSTAREAKIAEQEKIIVRIENAIKTHGDANCPVGAFEDELKEIRKLK